MSAAAQTDPKWLRNTREAVGNGRGVGHEAELLRMVDELRAVNADAQIRLDERAKWIDELRAKLAAVPGSTLALMHRWDAETSLRKELQAKLAEAEKARADIFTLAMENGNALRAAGQRADAAETKLAEAEDRAAADGLIQCAAWSAKLDAATEAHSVTSIVLSETTSELREAISLVSTERGKTEAAETRVKKLEEEERQRRSDLQDARLEEDMGS